MQNDEGSLERNYDLGCCLDERLTCGLVLVEKVRGCRISGWTYDACFWGGAERGGCGVSFPCR